MMIRWAPIGDILELRRRPIEIDPVRAYRPIGVRGFGRGIFDYPATAGKNLGKLRFFDVEPERLIVSNIKGWEGAVAVIGADEIGRIASNRFLTYAASNDEVDLSYVAHWLLSDPGLEELGRASPGSADRNRTLSIKNFEAIQVPLPHIDAQRRIAAHLGRVATASTSSSNSQRLRHREVIQSAISARLERSQPCQPLSAVAEINPRPTRVSPDDEVGFVPMSAVSDSTGAIEQVATRRKAELTSGYKQFTNGDVIFARITPCMQNGKSAIYQSEGLPVAYGSTEFHVVRTSKDLSSWLHSVFRSPWFIDRAVAAFTGTAGQQRVPTEFLRRIVVPIPKNPVQEASKIVALQKQERDIDELQNRSHELSSSILPAARNEVFSAMQ